MARATLVHLLLLGLSSMAAADVVVAVSDIQPLPLKDQGAVSSAAELFEHSVPEEHESNKGGSVIVSSYAERPHDLAIAEGHLFASSDSLVRGAVDAWAQHQHLVLRPDVVWFEILAKLNLYMAKNAEQLRHLFVDFEGRKEIVVREWTWQRVVDAFRGEMQQRVKTDWLLDWITPGFSTSTVHDNTTSSVLMMGLMQQYFKFSGGIICGLPSVRLLGQRDDWVALLGKLDRLREFGDEPAQYADKLRPILASFVRTWDEPESAQVQSFWRQIVRAEKVFSCGSGPVEYDISGWITGFLHWSSSGELRVAPGAQPAGRETTIDGVTYFRANLNQLPVGYAKAPLKMLDYPKPGVNTQAYVLAGNIGIARAELSQARGYQDPGRKEAVAQPLSAWFLYGPVGDEAEQRHDVGSHDELQDIYGGLRLNCPKGGR